MTVNVGTVDRALRIVLGLALVLTALFGGLPLLAAPAAMYGAVAVGVILLATAGMRFCPLYRLVGVRTCKV